MTSFTERLTNWYRANKRELPWRETNHPYPIWMSEIILQQTRVEQGMPYWRRFMEAFPTIHELADAPEEQVLRLWQGLGYYSRARNLHATAQYISRHLNGTFPSTYEEILPLKGIGPYTAAAIASICFDEPRPVVDGNVFRFIARYFGIETDIASSKARKEFEVLLQDHIPSKKPGDFNQALMEFGSKQCAPAPTCEGCPFAIDCFAFQNARQNELPVKLKKVKVRDRFFHYLVIRWKDKFLMNLRSGNDVWKGLYDFYLLEGRQEEEEVLKKAEQAVGGHFLVEDISEEVKHILSHQKIIARFYAINLDDQAYRTVIQKTELHAFSTEELLNLPKPKLIVNYLNQRGLN